MNRQVEEKNRFEKNINETRNIIQQLFYSLKVFC